MKMKLDVRVSRYKNRMGRMLVVASSIISDLGCISVPGSGVNFLIVALYAISHVPA
jgi:hypothetical protein